MKKDKCKLDIITFNLLIYDYGKNRDFSIMEQVFKSMLLSKENPTLSTFSSMITNYGKATLMKKAELDYRKITTLGHEPNKVTYVKLHSQTKFFKADMLNGIHMLESPKCLF